LTLSGQAVPADATITHPSDLDTRRLLPNPKGTSTQQAMVHGSQEVTTDTKQIHQTERSTALSFQ
jgi:hypothetical protein